MQPITHRLAKAHFDELAAGAGSVEVVAVLRSTQLSKRILMVYSVAEVARAQAPHAYVAAGLDEALETLAAARRASPDAVAEVLLYPHVGAWAVRTLRQLVGPEPDATRSEADLGHLGAIAAVAALRAGQSFETSVRVRDRAVMLPTAGLVRVAAPDGWARLRGPAGTGRVEIVVVREDAGSVVIPVLDLGHGKDSGGGASVWWKASAEPRADASWLALRRLRSVADDHAIELAVDDLDPFRHLEGLDAADRLSAADVAAWQRCLDEAWKILVRPGENRAAAIASGLRCLVPLDPGRGQWAVSASSGDAVGAVGLTPPGNGLVFAATLVHESQHAKLLALLDMVDLCREGETLYYAPWRADPRPIGGLLQGAYAYLGVTSFWRDHRLVARGTSRQVADFEFARWREAVSQTLGVLGSSGMLTELGTAFLAGMASSAGAWSEDPVPAVVRELALDIGAAHATAWRLRNLRPDPTSVTAAARSWLAGQPNADARTISAAIVASPRGQLPEPHLELARLRLVDPGRFARLREEPNRLGATVPNAALADLLLMSGDYAEAARAYHAEIAAGRERPDAWTGLAISHARLGTADQRTLVSRPEVIRAVCQRIGALGGEKADPEAVAAWLVSG
ncbi:HEXXH motif domain-containing protein [Pseudofrankia inefficax]|uniref:HEXXH motif domain-containing protein n=1 Tax=Pseudofrankia inefficax (strain DSM 45817 / CECT 9037 / DDB 130130 / EuI1c) TaxID=298654 RepID=E3IX98_PSEI1|nr:HEXXH motif domain-containing protein [Pseudofrankia inefficax]ADP84998.1 hypothetical protein FraEuI1c_7031 [Pseudofrankia inefficax]